MQKLSYDKLDPNNPLDIKLQGEAEVNGIINDYSKTGTLNDEFTKWNNAVLQTDKNERVSQAATKKLTKSLRIRLTKTHIQNNSDNYSKNYAVNLNGTDHMRFKHITFSGTGSSYRRQMVVAGVVDSLVLDSCHFETNNTSIGSSSNYTSFYGSNAYLSGLQIINSTFENTHNFAIYIDANAVTPRPSNIEISNNRFINMFDGIFLEMRVIGFFVYLVV